MAEGGKSLTVPGNLKYRGTKRKIEEAGDGNSKEQTDIKRFFCAKASVAKPPNIRVTPLRPLQWKWKGTVMFYETEGMSPSEKIAAFDFDNTLAKTSLFIPGPDAWSVLYPSCLTKLRELHQEGYKLVIFTNQAGIARSKNNNKVITEKQSRLKGFVKKASLPFQIFVATAKDENRKPNTGMWHCLVEECNGGVKVDLSKSFFVGDAAGRAKDHSDSDKRFAAKCNLKFYTEDKFFS